MISDFPSRPSSSINFIKRNIQSCVNPARLSSAPAAPSAAGFGIRGVPLIIRSKKSIATKQHNYNYKGDAHNKILIADREIENQKSNDFVTENIGSDIRLTQAQQQNFRQHSGVRRASIKSKRNLLPLQNKAINGNEGSSIKASESQRDVLKNRCYSNREVLFLPVTSFPGPQRPHLPPEVFLQVTGQSVTRTGKKPWEAIESRLERRTRNCFERLLAVMERQTISNASEPHILDGRGRYPNSNSIDIKDFVLQNKSELDNSYQNVHQRKVDSFTNEESGSEKTTVEPESAHRNKQKRKLPSKLEIKIAQETPGLNLDMKIITAGLEEVNIEEEVDNCGNLTPVITFNHVSTLNPLEQLATVSPGGSNKSSRSPSPLLEIPIKSGGKITKRPPQE